MGTEAKEKQLRQQLGRELRRARLALQLTQAEVAERVETDPETISRLERGTSLPSLTRLLVLAETLNVTVASLLGRASPRTTDELDELQRSFARLSEEDRQLAAAIMRTIVEARGHTPKASRR